MRFFLLLLAFGVSSSLMSHATSQNFRAFDTSFVEDNDLWIEDDINSKEGITRDMFNTIIAAGLDVYSPIAAQNGERLRINSDWNSPLVGANCSRAYGYFTVNLYGGLARREEITPEGFALVLCHELGHGYGSTPYLTKDVDFSERQDKFSAEGQSDYYGAKECLRKLLPKIAMPSVQPTAYMENRCKKIASLNSSDFLLCLRQLSGSISLGTLLASIKDEPEPSFETPDQTEVDQTETSYPATVQCRTDTYHNGSLNLDRPHCWFK